MIFKIFMLPVAVVAVDYMAVEAEVLMGVAQVPTEVGPEEEVQVCFLPEQVVPPETGTETDRQFCRGIFFQQLSLFLHLPFAQELLPISQLPL
jgi:hypothetical protein